MILYMDTSALLKKYFKEPGSNEVISRWKDKDFFFACFDQKLSRAAQMEGLQTLPESSQ